MFRGVLPYILGDLHGAEMRAAHAAEVRCLRAVQQREFRHGIDSNVARAFALSGLPIYVAFIPVGSIRARSRNRVKD